MNYIMLPAKAAYQQKWPAFSCT